MIPETANTSNSIANHQAYSWHQPTWQKFTQARSTNHLPHAILLSGEEGIAKSALAERMAKSLLCKNVSSSISTTNITNFEACGECQSCKTYESGANPDFTQIALLEDKKQIAVDQIRALSEFLNYSRSFNTYRVVIINPVERMNVNAANSLLKSLEEPTENTVLILVTAKVSDLLQTIKSRCQLFNVASPNKDESIAWLQQHQQQNKNIKNIPIDSLFEMVGTQPLNAESLSQEEIDNKDQFFKHLDSVIKHQMSVSQMAKEWEKHSLENLLNWQIKHIQIAIKEPFNSSSTKEQGVTNGNTSQQSLAQHLNEAEKWALYQNLIKQKQYVHTSVNALMFIENMIMLWCKS